MQAKWTKARKEEASFIRQDRRASQRDVTQDFLCHGHIRNIPTGKLDMGRVAQGIYHRMNLGAATSTTYTHALILGFF